LRLERICLRSLVGNKFGYNVIAACITTPTLYCSANRKPTTWTQKAPMHRRTVNSCSIVCVERWMWWVNCAMWIDRQVLCARAMT